MNNQGYEGIQWIQHHSSSGDLKGAAAAAQLIADAQQLQVTEILDGNGDEDDDGNTAEYMMGADDAADLDQMAAENLIFMARDGQMVDEIITAQDGDTVVVSAGDGTSLELEQAAALVQSPALVVERDAYAASSALVVFGEDTPQIVTEEVITDDWVQHQGEECVEIPAEQILGSNSSHVLLDMVQDEYTALRPYPCDFCSRRFRKKASLNNHMIAHQNDRPHLCKLCGARFSRRVELINHFKAHAEQQYADEAEVHTEVVKFEPQRREMDDHFYEQDWQTHQSEVSASEQLHNERDLPLIQSTSVNSSSTSSTVAGAIAPTSSSASTSTMTTRGRVSRLKLKEDTQYMVVEQKTAQTDLDFLGCQDLQAESAAVKLTQDQSPSHEPNFPIIDDSKPFVCQQCGLAFAREKALNSHVKNHRVDSPFECNQCNEMFWDTNSLHEHQKTHQFEDSNSEYDPAEADAEVDDTQSDSESEQLYGEFYCGECGISFHRQDLLRRHAKQHKQQHLSTATKLAAGNGLETDAQHCCNTCGETFAEALDLLAHAEIHARFPPFKCVLCGESFYEEQAIKRHLHTRHTHEMTANSCILCGKECRDRKALIKHAWDHSREKCHSCSKCGKNFHNKARLKRHMASHRDKSVVCDVCQEEFPDGRTLSNHRHSHSTNTSGKLFPCPECNKTFGSRSSQQIHVRIHTGERPYGCRFCWKAFADGGTLRKHERIHTGEKPYACSVCPRAFNQRVVLREHIRSHHSGKDASRGTFYCTVCGAELTTSNELIQHLIQHSDLNTAKQRQPVSGPRKYKRRRKLQPHEIAHLRAECKSDNFGSDLDISDFDIETVDDLLGINTEPKNKASKRKSKKTESSPTKRTATANSSSRSTKSDEISKTSLTSDGLAYNNNNNNSYGKQHYDSTNSANSDKLWETKFLQRTVNNQEDSYKTLFNNVEQGLQTIDTLVVHSQKTRRAIKQASDSGAQRTQKVQFKTENNKAFEVNKSSGNGSTTGPMATSNGAVTRSRKKVSSKTQAKANARPRMIHTEKSRTTSGQEVGGNGSYKRTRAKTYITRTETTNIDLLSTKAGTLATSSTNIVDDYEIISPATQPPNQISSSPLHIKQEHEQQHLHNNQHHQQNQLQQIYEAHLLLEASSLRKETYEKFNPSIVNDLEEILRSPLKCERNVRHRFTSESSSTPQYLPEDEQHLIKIEPTSPDLREIVEGQRNITSAGTSARTTQLRPLSSNSTRGNKGHLDQLDNELPGGRSMQRGKDIDVMQQQQSHNSKGQRDKNNANTINGMKAANAVANAAAASAYLNYNVDSFNVGVGGAGVSNVDVASQYFSISEVVSAADATEAAAAAAKAAAASAKPERKVRQFECEMCSAVFYDRTQLLEHVHIHI